MALLSRANRARQSGDVPAARALLRALASQRPDLPQIWLALAASAETRAEQRHALERVIALDPQNPLAQRGLERMGASPAPPPAPEVAPSPPAPEVTPSPPAPEPAPSPPEAGVGAAPSLTPTQPSPEEQARAIRWPLYVVIGVALLIVLLALWWLRPGADAPRATLPTASPSLPGATPALASATPGLAAQPGSPPADTPPAPSASPSLALPATAPPTAALPTRPTLAIGQVVQSGEWHVALLRPEDAVLVDGSIGAFQPAGRFLLALVAIGNDGTAPARIPPDLLVLVDRAGKRYPANPAISSAYLAAYGRGQHGDLSMEEAIPADGGNKSIPLIFDVPPDARDLRLLVQGAPASWPVGRSSVSTSPAL